MRKVTKLKLKLKRGGKGMGGVGVEGKWMRRERRKGRWRFERKSCIFANDSNNV